MVKAFPVIGWREWVSIPFLGVGAINAKVDTGANTSALHVSQLTIFKKGRYEYAHFIIHPSQYSKSPAIECETRVLGYRKIKSSTGHSTVRPVIRTLVALGEYQWECEITLINREEMNYRMLLGREAIKNRFLVNAGRSHLIGENKLSQKGKIRAKK